MTMKDYEILSHMYEGVYVVNKERKIIFWNKGCEHITGFSESEVVGKSCFDNILNHITADGKELCHDGCPLHDTLKTGKINEAEVFLHHKEGYRIPISTRTIPVIDDEIVAAVEVFTTLNKIQLKEIKNNRKLNQLLITDELTEIPNRRYLDFYLKQKVEEKEEFDFDFGVLFFDFDNFKLINDTYGHITGDDILKMVAKTLSANSRSNDKIGRWGGDEFIAIVHVSDEYELQVIADKLRILVSKSYHMIGNQKHINVTVSVGGAIIRSNETIKQLIRRADKNMYISKNTGCNKVTIK